MSESKVLAIRVPSELHRKVKATALEEDITMQTYIINLLKDDLKKKEKITV